MKKESAFSSTFIPVALGFQGLLLILLVAVSYTLGASASSGFWRPPKPLLAATALATLLLAFTISRLREMSKLVQRVGEIWQSYWFGRNGAYSLGVLRVAVPSSILISFPRLDYTAFLESHQDDRYLPKAILL